MKSQTFFNNLQYIVSVTFSLDGTALAFGSWGKTIRL